MYINQIDKLFDSILNRFNKFLIRKKLFDKIKRDTNFVKYQNLIINNIKEFNNLINNSEIVSLVKKEENVKIIRQTIIRYCAFYIYLGIGYNYRGERSLFITNIIESSNNQKVSSFQIQNFYNSENNSKIIAFYSDIKNILSLMEFKTIERIKIILSNNPIKFNTTIKLFNNLGEDYILEYNPLLNY